MIHGEAGEWVMQKGSDAKNWATEKGSEALKTVFDEDADIGKSSAKFESNGDAGTISTGKGDHGGISYGKYQMSSKYGVPQRFLKTYPEYGKQFEGMTITTPEFQAKWKDIAKNDPKFGDAQHEYIRKNFYNIFMHNLEKSGIDLSGRGKAVKEMLFSTAVQHGPNTKVINEALKGRDISKMTDAEMITEEQRFKNLNVDSHHRNSAPNIRVGVKNRTVAEENYLLSMIDNPTPKAQQIKTASVSPVTPPAMPSQVKSILDAPKIAEPLNTSASRKQPSNPIIEPDVGQDVKDRKIAHIVTGGLSN